MLISKIVYYYTSALKLSVSRVTVFLARAMRVIKASQLVVFLKKNQTPVKALSASYTLLKLFLMYFLLLISDFFKIKIFGLFRGVRIDLVSFI